MTVKLSFSVVFINWIDGVGNWAARGLPLQHELVSAVRQDQKLSISYTTQVIWLIISHTFGSKDTKRTFVSSFA